MQLNDLKRKTIGGFGITMMVTVTKSLFGLLGQIVLARLLFPDDFGVFALAVMVSGAFAAVATLQADTYIIYKQEKGTELFFTVMIVQMMISAAIAMVYLMTIGWVEEFFTYEGLDKYLLPLVVVIVFNPLARVTRGMFSKDLKYWHVNIPILLAVVIQFAVSICLAYRGFGAWSLVWGLVTRSITEWFLSNVLLIWKGLPRFNFIFAEIKPFLIYLLPLLASSFLSYVYWNVDDLMVGKMLGEQDLGYYYFAFRIPHYMQLFSASLVTVALPLFAKLQNNIEVTEKVFGQLTRITAYLLFLVLVLVVVLGHEVIIYIFGEKWLPALVPFQIFVLVVVIRSTMTYWNALHQSYGITKYLLYFTPVNLVGITLLGYLLIPKYGILGMSIAVLVMMSGTIIGFVPGLTRKILPSFSYFRELWRPITVSVVVAVLGLIMKTQLYNLSMITSVIFMSGLVAAYIGSILFIDSKIRNDIKRLLKIFHQDYE